ncbi:MAG TPA: YciI family protein [Chloroflexota bacterium]|nr:YciI family protein [Chloroflexota bacterium]
MRYLTIFKAEERPDSSISQDEMVAMGKLIEEMARAGVLITTEGCHDSSSGARVRRSGGKVTVTDGPFTESKEVIGGFALLQVDSLQDAITWTKRFVEVAGDGESEIRQLYDTPAYPPG